MRKLLFALFVIIGLSSCVTTNRVIKVTTIDLKKYNDAGFWITEACTIGNVYEPVGIVSVYIESGREMEKVDKEKTDDIYGTSFVEKQKYTKKRASLEEAIELLHNEAVKQGANTIMNLRYRYMEATKNTPSAWEATGMAVYVNPN